MGPAPMVLSLISPVCGGVKSVTTITSPDLTSPAMRKRRLGERIFVASAMASRSAAWSNWLCEVGHRLISAATGRGLGEDRRGSHAASYPEVRGKLDGTWLY